MSYIINKTDGSVLTEVVDGTIDQTSTDLTLIGKNSSSYGEAFNENFIHLLENFANTTQPNYPIQGQLWFDTSESRLKVYDGSGFKVSGGTIVSNTVPSSIAQGDIWIDSYRKQLYFNDGNSTILAGPIYTAQQSTSGFVIQDVIDTNQINHTVVILYVAQVAIGCFSKDEFTPLDGQLVGFTGDVKVGFTASSYSGIKFNVPASVADALIADDSSLTTAESFLSTTNNSSSIGTITIANDTPLILGSNQNNEVKISTDYFKINSNIPNQNFEINLLNSTLKSALYINAENEWMGVYTSVPTATLDVAGDTRIRGSLTVEGNVTSISTTNVEISDKLIELAKTDSPDDTTADGGGIQLVASSDGSSDKFFTWSNANQAWTSSEHLNLASTKAFYINGFQVLSNTSLGLTVTSSHLTSVGTLVNLTVDQIYINGNEISNNSLGDSNIVLTPAGAGTVDVSGVKITSVATPDDPTDATNKDYVDTQIRSIYLGLSAEATGLTTSQIASNIIAKVYPADRYENGTECRIWCMGTGTVPDQPAVSLPSTLVFILNTTWGYDSAIP